MQLFDGDRGRRLCFIIVASAAILMYLGSIGGDYVWDDRDLVVENARIRSISGIPTIFTSGFIPAGRAQGLEYYRPIVNLSLLLDHQVWKLQPLGYHLTNLLIHAGVSVLVFLLALTYLPILPALAAGLFFAIHPAHTENVAWISGRTDPVAALFLLGSFLCYARFLRGQRSALAWSAILFGLAVLSKEAAILFPAVFLVHAVWGEKKSFRHAFLSLIPFAAVGCAYMFARSSVLGYQTARDLHAVGMGQRLIESPANFFSSLLMLFVPGPSEPLHRFYSAAAFPNWWILAGYIAAASAVTAALALRRKLPVLSLSIAWILAGIPPVLNIIPLPQPILAERFMYIPSIGAAVLVGWLVSKARPKAAFACGAAVLLIVAVSAVRTASGPNYWKSDVALWVRMVELEPRNPVFRHYLGTAYFDAGRMEDAHKEFLTALSIEPRRYAEPHLGLASIYFRTGQVPKSFPHYKAAIKIDPKAPNNYNNLGVAYASIGRYAEAEAAFKQALKIWPEYPEAHLNLAKLYSTVGENRKTAQSAMESTTKMTR